MPHQYERLRDHGVRADATFRGCAIPPLGRDRRCRLSLRFDGRVRTWVYSENYAQFRSLPVGAAVPVLVDPTDRSTVFGVALVGIGLAGVGAFVWFFRPDPLSVFRLS